MKRFFRTAWILSCIALIIIYIISSLGSFIPPAYFSYISVLSIGFLFILAAYILFFFISFFVARRLCFIMLIILPICYFNLMNSFAFGADKWQPQKDSTAIRILTWNVASFINHNGKGKSYTDDRKGILQTIHDYNPDVLCLQEYRNIENAKGKISVRMQLDSLGYKYSFCSNDYVGSLHRNSRVYVEWGVAIFSKFPFTRGARININHEENENLIYVDIPFQSKTLRIFTAHLQSFELYKDTADAKYSNDNIYEITYKKRKATQYKIRETEIKHQQQVTVIRKAIEGSSFPIVYCGDLNTTPTSYNYRCLKGKNLHDAFLVKGSGIGNTFYKLGPMLRIDICFTDTALQVLQCKREKRKLSDHYPVITDIAWKH
jgi:endonuclease/exonuclease/phosphatase family metal-dependent hydrolase